MSKQDKGLIFILCCGLVVAIFITACPPAEAPDVHGKAAAADDDAQRISRVVFRVTDREAGVVCYTRSNGGIHCLPISDTLLGDE